MSAGNIPFIEMPKEQLRHLDPQNFYFGKSFTNYMLEADYKDGAWTNAVIKKFEPHLKGSCFQEKSLAEKKLKELVRQLPKSQFAYREGAPSKEEVMAHNHAVDKLMKDAILPSDDLVIYGEGRKMGERSFILVRGGDVVGYGHTEHDLDQILAAPERYITGRPTQKIQARQQVIHYLKILKNLRFKTDSWRELPKTSI